MFDANENANRSYCMLTNFLSTCYWAYVALICEVQYERKTGMTLTYHT